MVFFDDDDSPWFLSIKNHHNKTNPRVLICSMHDQYSTYTPRKLTNVTRKVTILTANYIDSNHQFSGDMLAFNRDPYDGLSPYNYAVLGCPRKLVKRLVNLVNGL